MSLSSLSIRRLGILPFAPDCNPDQISPGHRIRACRKHSLAGVRRIFKYDYNRQSLTAALAILTKSLF